MKPLQHLLLSTLGGLALALAVVGVGVAEYNTGLRRQLGDQQQYIQQSVQLESLYREMVRALAELSARSSDEPLRALLQRHGISYSVDAPAAPAKPVAPPQGARK
jgi:hypothetical protein